MAIFNSYFNYQRVVCWAVSGTSRVIKKSKPTIAALHKTAWYNRYDWEYTRYRVGHPKAKCDIQQGLVNVLIEHHPTIGDIISNKYLWTFTKPCSNALQHQHHNFQPSSFCLSGTRLLLGCLWPLDFFQVRDAPCETDHAWGMDGRKTHFPTPRNIQMFKSWFNMSTSNLKSEVSRIQQWRNEINVGVAIINHPPNHHKWAV